MEENKPIKPMEKSFPDTILDVIPGGLVGINLTGNKLLYSSKGLCALLGYTQPELKAMECGNWYQILLHPDDQGWVKQESENQIRRTGKLKICYRLIKKDGSVIWVTQYAGLIDSPHFGKHFFCQILDYTETKNALLDAEKYKAKMDALINTIPGGVARLVLDKGFQILLASEGYYRMRGYTETECREAPIYNQGLNFVLLEDVPVILKAVEELLRTEKPISVDYRVQRKDGTILWNTAYCSQVENSEDGLTIDAVFIDTTVAKKNERRLLSLIDSVPGGVARLHLEDGEIVIDYANDGFYRLIGYCPQEFAGDEIQRKYSRVIHPGDRERFQRIMAGYMLSEGENQSITYRILTKTGEARWMRINISRAAADLEHQGAAQCIIADITQEKLMMRQAALSEERYRIISEQAQDVIYEWDLETGYLRVSPVYKVKFGYSLPENYLAANLLVDDIIHEDDKPIVQKVLEDVLNNTPYREAEYRVKKADGSYIWIRNRMTPIFDENQTPLQIVGMLTDIDDYKKETAALRERAQRDPLTGLLNRKTTQEKIQAYLIKRYYKKHAFFVIDVDDFKNINDTLGHLTGDSVLKGLAARFREQFRESDIIGRLGGDEFIIFMTDIPSREVVQEKAENLNAMYRQILQVENKEYPMSISIGIALYPEDGIDFRQLYQHADMALYRVKNKGRDSYAFYSSPNV